MSMNVSKMELKLDQAVRGSSEHLLKALVVVRDALTWAESTTTGGEGPSGALGDATSQAQQHLVHVNIAAANRELSAGFEPPFTPGTSTAPSSLKVLENRVRQEYLAPALKLARRGHPSGIVRVLSLLVEVHLRVGGLRSDTNVNDVVTEAEQVQSIRWGLATCRQLIATFNSSALDLTASALAKANLETTLDLLRGYNALQKHIAAFVGVHEDDSDAEHDEHGHLHEQPVAVTRVEGQLDILERAMTSFCQAAPVARMWHGQLSSKWGEAEESLCKSILSEFLPCARALSGLVETGSRPDKDKLGQELTQCITLLTAALESPQSHQQGMKGPKGHTNAAKSRSVDDACALPEMMQRIATIISDRVFRGKVKKQRSRYF